MPPHWPHCPTVPVEVGCALLEVDDEEGDTVLEVLEVLEGRTVDEVEEGRTVVVPWLPSQVKGRGPGIMYWVRGG